MNNITSMKFCSEFDEDIQIGNNTDNHVKVILDKYILNVRWETTGGDSRKVFIIYYDDMDYSTSKIFLFHRILIEYGLSKNYKQVIFRINYVNLDLQVEKVFSEPIGYPEYILMCGEYCEKCVKRKECKELKNAYLGDIIVGTLENDAQILSTYNIISNRRKALEATEEQLKVKLYNRILENANSLLIEDMGIILSKKITEKDTITYTAAKDLELVNDATCIMKVGEIKKIIAKDKTLSNKIKFVKVKMKEELCIEGTKKSLPRY